MRSSLFALTVVASAFFARSAVAQTTDVATYYGGEFDNSPTNLGAAFTAVDNTGGNDLNVRTPSAPTWSTTVTAPPTTLMGASTYSYDFNGSTAFQSTGTVLGSTDNFGMDVWVNASAFTDPTTKTELVMVNGSGSDGIGVGMSNGNWAGLLGGLTWLDGGNTSTAPVAVSLNTWTELSVVEVNGVASFYVNGVLEDTYSGTTNYDSAPLLNLGADGASTFFEGNVDDARLFTVGSTFSTADLNGSAVPEPSFYAALAGISALGLAFWRRRAVA